MTLTHSLTHPTPIQEFSRQVPTSEGAVFAAARMGCLFVEGVRQDGRGGGGVTEAFNDVVSLIVDTPSLWHEEKPKSSGRTAAAANTANTTAVSGPHRGTVEGWLGILICPRRRTKTRSAGVCFSSVDGLFLVCLT